MKQYRVLKEMINAPVGTILTTLHLCGGLYREDQLPEDGGAAVLHNITDAIAQGFIEPYTTEPKRWRAEKQGAFWFIDTMLEPHKLNDWGENTHDTLYNCGNYYRTEATAELVDKAQKLFFELLHDTESTYMNFIKLEKAIKEAKKAVLEDDSNE